MNDYKMYTEFVCIDVRITCNCHKNKMGENFICGSSSSWCVFLLFFFRKKFFVIWENSIVTQRTMFESVLYFMFRFYTNINHNLIWNWIIWIKQIESVDAIAISSFTILNCKWKKTNFTNTWKTSNANWVCWNVSLSIFLRSFVCFRNSLHSHKSMHVFFILFLFLVFISLFLCQYTTLI